MAMVSKQEKIRSKLERKVFDVIGKTVTLKSKSSPLYNNRGEEESQTYTDSSITIVPYSIVHAQQEYEAFGNLPSGSMAAAVPYTVTVAIDDIIVIESENWLVKVIEKNYLPDNVVTIVGLVREQN